MLATRVLTVSSHFKRNINFFPKTKSLLNSKDSAILNQAFLCSISENPTVRVLEKERLSKAVYYREYLLNNSKYTNLIFHGGVQTSSKTVAILNQLDQERENIPNLKDELSDQLDKELNQFSFSEFCEVVFLVTKFVSQYDSDPMWEKILESIDKECLARMPDWTPDELQKMILVSMALQQPKKFKKKLMCKLINKSSTSQQIVFLFYFIFQKKFSVLKEDLFNLQKKTLKILPEINSIEAGIIAEGINYTYKTLHIRDLFYGVLKKGFEETVDKIPFLSICKFARIMSRTSTLGGIKEFQENSIETAVRHGVEEVIILALTGEKVRYLDLNLRTVLMKEVKNHIRQISTFYIERVAYIATLFNIHDEEFLKQALDAFEAKEITENNRKNCVLFLSRLANFKLYSKKLLNIVFEKEFVEKLMGYGKRYMYALWLIYCGLKIERPDYLTFDLDPKVKNKIYQLNRIKFFTCPRYHSKLWQIEAVLTELYGKGTAKYLTPLPLYSIGILMKFDKNSNPQKLSEELEKHNKTFEVKPLKDEHIWLLIIWAGQTNISNFGPTLDFQTQIRQLNAIGYTTLPVYKNISPEDQETSDYLKNLINMKLGECYKNQKDVVIN